MLNNKKRKNVNTEEALKNVLPLPTKEEIEKTVEPIVIEFVEELEKVEVIDERVICLNTEVIYDDYKHASKETGVSMGAIKRCCDGATKSAGKDEEGNKLVWKYVRDI
jgi:hypothetical protein